jgi:hypothetical protein
MRTKALAAVAALAVVASGCYHATVDTGRAPSGVVVENQWAHSFIGGLVPPSTVNVAQDCPQGVSRVETQLSFLNGLIGGLTWGIYTPMTIRVTCAAGGAASAADASSDGTGK